ncbi:hypothetical protein [Lyngbya aestuarii]|uniref:hypothetical protein n=1 Tax=Lyngbya aestuarii TaxID=118322 RepID=UPI00403D9A3A
MIKQMCWLSLRGTEGNKVLHLRVQLGQPWQPYTAFPQYAAPDYPIANGSKGYATFHKLRCAGWTLLPSGQVEQGSWEQQRKSA